MKLAVMQPYLFPYIGYFQLINAVDLFIVLDDVNYINKGWINRNKILVNGEEHIFTFPLIEAGQNKLIKEINLMDDEKWRKKFLKTIKYNYFKAPYFNAVFTLIENIITYPERNLSTVINFSLFQINSYIGIKTKINPTSSLYDTKHLKGSQKILHICKQENANVYINPIGGLELYSKDEFKLNGISIFFLKSNLVHYQQFGNRHIPFLSIIDVMMFNDPQEIRNMMYEYELL